MAESCGDLGSTLESDSLEDVSEEVVSVQLPSLALGGLSEFEDHGQAGHTTALSGRLEKLGPEGYGEEFEGVESVILRRGHPDLVQGGLHVSFVSSPSTAFDHISHKYRPYQRLLAKTLVPIVVLPTAF